MGEAIKQMDTYPSLFHHTHRYILRYCTTLRIHMYALIDGMDRLGVEMRACWDG